MLIVYTGLFIILLIPLIYAETTFFDQDDAFILGNSATSGAIEEKPIIPTGGSGCKYVWNCTDWGECLVSGKQTRTCVNIGT